MPKVVITMPAYRAEQTLAKTVAEIPGDFADLLILVDDASPDNTASLARELGIDVYVHSENRGYGGNQKTCYTEALRSGADVIVLLHPDYQYEPKAVPLLVAPILAGDADMTFGSRFAGLGDPIGGGMPLYRFVGNRVTTVAENFMLGSRFTEMHSGLRAYTRRCLLSLPYLAYSDDFVFDSQLLVDAVTSGQRVVEVPIPTRYTKESSSIAVGSSLRYIGGSLAYAARRAAARGRRGRRSPVAYPERAIRRAPRGAPLSGRVCPICDGTAHAEIPPRAPDPSIRVACTRCGVVSALEAPLRGIQATGTRDTSVAAQVLELVGGYVVRGDDMLVVGEELGTLARLASEADWQVSTAEPSGLPAPIARSGATARRAGAGAAGRRGQYDAAVLVDALGDEPVQRLRGLRPLLDSSGILAVAAPYAPGGPARGLDAVPRPFLFTAAAMWTALARAGFRMVDWVPPARPVARQHDRVPLALAVGRLAERQLDTLPARRIVEPEEAA